MAAIDEAIEDLESYKHPGQVPYLRITGQHIVIASTLRRQLLSETLTPQPSSSVHDTVYTVLPNTQMVCSLLASLFHVQGVHRNMIQISRRF